MSYPSLDEGSVGRRNHPRWLNWAIMHRLVRDRLCPVFLLPFFYLFTISLGAQEPVGSIRGTVLTNLGDPVENAHVYADVMDGSKILTVLSARSDEEGVFTFSHLAMGTYRLSAEKEEAGFLSTRPDIFLSRPELNVVLTDAIPRFNTVVRFAPKAGVLSGWVRDAVTGRPIAAHLSLAPMSGRGGWSTTGTNKKFEFRLLIPSDTAVRFGACAEGYKPWFYSESSDPSRPAPVQLKPDY